jgi:hypothetical protein
MSPLVLVLVLPSQGEEMEGQGRHFELCLQSETTFPPKFVGMAMTEVNPPATAAAVPVAIVSFAD